MTEQGGQGQEATRPSFKLTLKGAGVTVDRDVPEGVASDIISLVLGGGAGLSPGTRSRGTSGSGRPGRSLREVLDEAGAQKNPQIVAAIGQFLMDDTGQERFTRSQVKERFSQAGQPTPANIVRDFQAAVTSGWIAEEPKGQFYVTESGRKAIAEQFAGHSIRRPARRRGH